MIMEGRRVEDQGGGEPRDNKVGHGESSTMEASNKVPSHGPPESGVHGLAAASDRWLGHRHGLEMNERVMSASVRGVALRSFATLRALRLDESATVPIETQSPQSRKVPQSSILPQPVNTTKSLVRCG